MIMQLSVDRIVEDPWGFAEVLALFLVVIAHFILGGKFFWSSKSSELIESQKRVEQGYGAWFISIGLGYGTYVLDRFWRFFFESRFFLSYDERVINRDYWLFSFVFLALAFAFLTYVIDKYLLNRKKPWISVFCVIVFVYCALFRVIENAVYNEADPPGVVSDIMGYLIYAFFGIVLLVILSLYIRIARAAPEGSTLKKKAVAAVIGIIMWLAMLLGGSNQFSGADWFPGAALLGPLLTILALLIIYYGFSRI